MACRLRRRTLSNVSEKPSLTSLCRRRQAGMSSAAYILPYPPPQRQVIDPPDPGGNGARGHRRRPFLLSPSLSFACRVPVGLDQPRRVIPNANPSFPSQPFLRPSTKAPWPLYASSYHGPLVCGGRSGFFPCGG